MSYRVYSEYNPERDGHAAKIVNFFIVLSIRFNQ